MRKILIPTDFSNNSFNALCYAAELFKYDHCEIFLLHTYAEEIYIQISDIEKIDLNSLKKEFHQTSVEKLEQVEKKIRDISPNPKHRIKSIAAYGLLIDEVNELISAENIDVVVMGTRGKTNDRKLTFGSNTLQVIKYVECPILSIPAKYKYNKTRSILFPTNFMVPYQRRELKLVSEIARSFCASVHMLYISSFGLESLRQKENLDFVKEQFKDIELNLHLADEPDRLEGIMKQIKILKADLLVMVNSRYSYLENILAESTIDKIGLHPKIPFLVLQNFHRKI